MSRFNLSEWALAHRNFVVYLMGLMMVLGIMGYRNLGQSEDPPFTFKIMQMKVNWPGATAQEMENQIADPIERTLMETPYVDVVRSFSRPGETQFLIMAKDDTRSEKMPDLFYQVRKRVGDMAQTLPDGVQGPYFNDEFGETYGNIFALVGSGYTMAQMKDVADDLRKELLTVPNVSKVSIIGEQPERVYVEFSSAKLANLGVSLQDVLNALQAQNEQVGTGIFETDSDRISLRVSGAFSNINDVRNLAIRSGSRVVLLKDIADVHRAYADPATPAFRFMGEQAQIGRASCRERVS
jgi:multidrug efflux pump